MTVAVMQPYLFPYIGYFQLAHHSDYFVFYDDVNFIKRGHVNRNRILNNEQALRFTLPVLKASQNAKINELFFDIDVYKLLKTISHSYSKAPFFEEIYELVERVVKDENRNVAKLASNSVKEVFEYLGLEKKFYYSSELNYDRTLSAADKLCEITKLLNDVHYCNSIGGLDLYEKEHFAQKGISLSFISTKHLSYDQKINGFVKDLSIIDVLMFNSIEDTKKLFEEYHII
ncbi:hypothetical protein E2K93_01560 [Thalassotalea sp. HSM 43]|uniref:WbqC family protein n=1 Tax=Thalassotalea sp. HSM 43 TaxID=2552945 RepID=UPI0010804AA5|nr:WbqC family protein [Thalassotalea sp. HSM 43]QBY03134.1 hypothetical protein E2K93_01560 [Thalassotalea sp. HSM 43]